jgi:putative transcriptional regulator
MYFSPSFEDRTSVTIPAGHPADRALDALLAGYAAGSLSAPLHVLVAGHLAISPQSRAFVRSLESANAAALEGIVPVPFANRQACLDAIFADDAPAHRVDLEPVREDNVLPAPLVHYFRTTLQDIRWRTLLPGVKEFKIEKTEQGEAVLYWIKPGRKMPTHTHEGSEYTLVLKGGFTEVSGHYRRGDIAIADQEIDHRPVADLDEDCICFAVTDAPLRLTGPVGRVVQRLFQKKN